MSSLYNSSYYQSLPTTGAIAVTNEKGEKTMQKVKVQRYITGRKPRFATDRDRSSSESESSSEEETDLTTNYRSSTQKGQQLSQNQYITSYDNIKSEDIEEEDIEFKANDPRIRRLMSRREAKEEEISSDEEDRDRRRRQRHVLQPQIISIGPEDRETVEEVRHRRRNRREAEDESSEAEDDEENVERRHQLLRLKREEEDEELLAKVEDEEDTEEEEDEYEEDYTDSEDDTGPRLKPVFVPKKGRITLTDVEKEELKERQQKEAEKRTAEERKRQTLKMIEDDIRREEAEKEDQKEEEAIQRGIATVLTDDESEEIAYEFWKLRELKRIKREKEEKESYVKEKLEIERLRQMTEEQRQEELLKNPKLVTNAAPKGKYKYLQKYFHRGAFYLDEEDEVFKRDFAQPTLEDHFDRTTLPKVMQVKNFGRSGRTKYTHLVDQDTTAHDSPWVAETPQNEKWKTSRAAGMRQVFERPSGKRK